MSTRSHRNIMKHEHVFTLIVQTKTPEGSRTISKLVPQDRNSKLEKKALCTLLRTIPKVLLMHSETDIPKAWPNSSWNIQT